MAKPAEPEGLWTCPKCKRKFGRNRQAHECAPAMTIEDYFSTGPPWERPTMLGS